MLRFDHHRPIQVLVIEDNPGDVRLLEEAFRELRADIRLKVAKDGAEALDLIFQLRTPPENVTHPDIILLDLNLPKVSGHEVLTRIKANPDTRRIPVIVLTSSRAEADVRRAYDSYANAYLKKPSSLDDLVAAVDRIKTFWLELATLPN